MSTPPTIRYALIAFACLALVSIFFNYSQWSLTTTSQDPVGLSSVDSMRDHIKHIDKVVSVFVDTRTEVPISLKDALITVDSDMGQAAVGKALNCTIRLLGEEICVLPNEPKNSAEFCYSKIVQVSDDSQEEIPVRWGQMIPAGLHITMNMQTGRRAVSKIQASDKTQSTDLVVLSDTNSLEYFSKYSMSLQLKNALKKLQQLYNNDSANISQWMPYLTQVQEQAYDYKDGLALACMAANPGVVQDTVNDMFTHENFTVRHTVAIIIGTALQNNAEAQACVSKDRQLFDALLDRTVTDEINRDAWLFALSWLVRGNEAAVEYLFKPLLEPEQYSELLSQSSAFKKFQESSFSVKDSRVITPVNVIASLFTNWLDGSRFQARTIRFMADTFRFVVEKQLSAKLVNASDLQGPRMWCWLLQGMEHPDPELSTDITGAIGALIDFPPVDDQKVCWLKSGQVILESIDQ